MSWLNNIRDRHIRFATLFILFLCFLKMNWGLSITAVKHVVLTVRTHRMAVIESDLIQELSLGIIPFGQTVAHLLILSVIWIFVDRCIKFYDADFRHVEFESKTLRRENEELRKHLLSTNDNLMRFIGAVQQLSVQYPNLERLQDRLTELLTLLSKLEQKTPSKSAREAMMNKTGPDLFEYKACQKKTSGFSPALRRSKSKPKF